MRPLKERHRHCWNLFHAIWVVCWLITGAGVPASRRDAALRLCRRFARQARKMSASPSLAPLFTIVQQLKASSNSRIRLRVRYRSVLTVQTAVQMTRILSYRKWYWTGIVILYQNGYFAAGLGEVAYFGIRTRLALQQNSQFAVCK